MTFQLNATRPLAAAFLAAGLTLIGGCSNSGDSFWPFGSDDDSGKPAAVEINHNDFSKLGYQIRWTGYATTDKGAVITKADLVGDLLVLIDSNAYVTAMSANSGSARWSTIADEATAEFVGTVRSGRRIMVCGNYQVQMFDADTGALLDKQRFARVVSTRPLLIGPYLVFGTRSGEVMAHLTINGFRAWGYTMGGPVSADPVQMDEDACFVSEAGDLLVLDAQTGSSKGRARMYGGSVGAPATSGDAVFVASVDQSVYAFERFGGATRWRLRTDSRLERTPAYASGVVYVDIPSAGLTAIDARGGGKLWSAPGVTGTVIGTRAGRLIVWDGTTATILETNGTIAEQVTLPGTSALVTDNFNDGMLYVVRKDGSVSKFTPR